MKSKHRFESLPQPDGFQEKNSDTSNPQWRQHHTLQNQIQFVRFAPGKQALARKLEAAGTFVVLAFTLLSIYLIHRNYGWVLGSIWILSLWLFGFLQLSTIVIHSIWQSSDTLAYSEALRRADFMTRPIKKKTTSSGENDFIAFGSSCMQGWRRSMEDAHTLLLLEDGGFFGIYDGHRGPSTSKFCGEYMYEFVRKTPAFLAGDVERALYDGFMSIDNHLLNKFEHERSGSTAVVLYIKSDDMYCANAGDSRCILCTDSKAQPLSLDHKPFDPMEQTRIERAGGFVTNRRVNGTLALSRAIGDFDFKRNIEVPWNEQAVTGAPDIRVHRLNRDQDEFAIVACDGIWDVMSNEQVIEFVRPLIQKQKPLGEIAEMLIDRCLSPRPFGMGCDNMSVILVQFKRLQKDQLLRKKFDPQESQPDVSKVPSI